MSLVEAPRPATSGPPPAISLLRPPSPPLRRAQLRSDVRASVGDAAAYSMMVGVGETYFAAFALALGTGQTFAGLVATLPMLAGALLQLATPSALARFGSYRRWVVLCACAQAAALLVMPVAACFTSAAAAGWVFFAASAYWAASQATGPAWNTWIEEIVPRRLRARFFACRARTSQMFTLIGFVAGGIALQLGKANGWLLAAFVGIFLVGSVGRFLSAWFLSQQSEPSRGKYIARTVSPRAVFSRAGGGGTPLVLYLLAVQAAVQISGPYFTPFMLAQQRLSYFSYMVLIGIGFLGKVIALPLWGRIAHYAGARRLLWIGGVSIVPVAGLWIAADWFAPFQTTIDFHFGSFTLTCPLSAQMAYLGAIQLLSGIVWAAYELAMLLMFFEAIPRHDRASVLTLYNFGNAAALVVGSLLGAAILQFGHESHGAYMAIFGISSLARLFTVLLLRQAPQPRLEIVPIDAALQPPIRQPHAGGSA
jgi:MFS family permease